VTFKIISRHALCHFERYFVCVLHTEYELTLLLVSFVKRTQNDAQDDVVSDVHATGPNSVGA